MNCSTPGLPVHHQLLEFSQTHVHRVSDAIQPSHPLSSPSPPALNLSQHHGLFKWGSRLHQVAKVLDYKESWAWKNGCFWSVVFEKTRESPWDCKEIQPVHPKGDQSWVFTGRTDVEAETPIFGHVMQRADSFGKTLMLGKIEGRRRRGRQRMRRLNGITDWLNGHGFG